MQEITPGTAFVFLFITLGPIKLIAPFVQLTAQSSPSQRRTVALKTALISAVLVVGVALVGSLIARNWGISQQAMAITTGLILFAWSFLSVLEFRAAPSSPSAGYPQEGNIAAFPLSIPHTVTPAGLAMILFFAIATNFPWMSAPLLIGLLLAVMALNLGAMLTAHRLLKLIGGPLVLKVIGAVLLIIQNALAVQILLLVFTRIAAGDGELPSPGGR